MHHNKTILFTPSEAEELYKELIERQAKFQKYTGEKESQIMVIHNRTEVRKQCYDGPHKNPPGAPKHPPGNR